jgi:hypothetical protein
VVKVVVILAFSVEEGFASQLKEVISWEGSTRLGVKGLV